jgi:thioredoxin-related protein
MQPIVHGLEATYGDQIEFVYVNIDDPESDRLKQQYGFRYQPHFVLVDGNGEIVEQWLGYTDAAFFEQTFDNLLAN